VIKLPPDVKAAPPPAPVARVPATSNTAPAAAVAASPSDQKADAALRAAQLYVDNKMYAMAKTKLQNLIKAYPASEAAKKAKGMLAHLPDDAPNPESQ
jgi:TolA-binding protein